MLQISFMDRMMNGLVGIGLLIPGTTFHPARQAQAVNLSLDVFPGYLDDRSPLRNDRERERNKMLRRM